MQILNFFSSKNFLYLTFSLSIALHVGFLNMPPKSMHLWRQCHTLAVTRNFFEEGMNIFEPKVDNRFDTDGITGSQFPSFEFGLASIYHLTGEHYWVQRTYCLLLHLFGILGIYLLTKKLTNNLFLANLSAWAYTWSPLLFYYAITALPDNIALPFSIWGLYFFMLWFEKYVEKKEKYILQMLGCFFFTTLAGLTKIQYLALGFFILTYLIGQRKKMNAFNWTFFSLFGIAASGLSVGWYLYARWLIEKSGLTDFGLHFNPVKNVWEGFEILFSNLTSSLPESILNYSAFTCLLAAIYFQIKIKSSNSTLKAPFLIWSCVFVMYHIIELGQMRHHDYYMMAYMPILAIFSAYGAFKLAISKFRNIALILILLQPVLAFVRIVPPRFWAGENDEKSIFYSKIQLDKLQKCTDNKSLCIIGPDDSRCIFFYFLHKKGFGFGEEGLSKEQMENYISRGAKFLYTSKNDIFLKGELNPYIDNKICMEGGFYVYSLKNRAK